MKSLRLGVRRPGAKAPGAKEGELFSTTTLVLWCAATIYLIHSYIIARPASPQLVSELAATGSSVSDARSLGELALRAQAEIARQAALEASQPQQVQQQEEEGEQEQPAEEEPQEQQEEVQPEEAQPEVAEPAPQQPDPPVTSAGEGSAAQTLPDISGPLWTWDDHPKKYLMLVQGQEGFGAWNDIVWEYVDLAKELGRTLVEPCVRNGCLEPCRCGHVHNVPDIHSGNLDEHFADGKDPLDLPHIDFVCEPHTAWVHDQVGRTYPLSAYLDMRSLKATWPHIVRYSDWCENVLKKDAAVTQDTGFGGGPKRWIYPNGYCAELHWHECYPQHAPKMIGDFVFTNISFGRSTDFEAQLDTLRNDPAHTLFFYYAYRRYFDMLRFGRVGGSEFAPNGGFPNVPFNAGHLRAASNFIAKHFGSEVPLTVFHWRSEHVDEEMLEPCAGQLAELLGKFTWPDTPSGTRALLLSDMAAPNHNHILWHTYVGAKLAHQNGAMRIMMETGKLLKYDALHNNTDTGVLMIRDFLFASVFGDKYITCQGDFLNDCLGCFRSNSNFVKRIMDSRRRFGRPNHERWWALTQGDLPTAKLPPVDAKAAINNA